MSEPDNMQVSDEFTRALVQFVNTGMAAMCADLHEMAEGRYTGRHCEAWLTRPGPDR